MNRSDFGNILDSIVIPDGTPEEQINKQVFPISQASVEMLPSSLFRYRPVVCREGHGERDGDYGGEGCGI